MLEECFCCAAPAPRWDTEDYDTWTVELTPDGEYLGAICPGCFAGDGLAFLDASCEERERVALRVLRGASTRAARVRLPRAA